MNDKYTVENVRSALLTHWDPIGVSSNRFLYKEYDLYIDGIIALLKDISVTPQIVADHLVNIEQKNMKLRGDRRQALLAAQALIKL